MKRLNYWLMCCAILMGICAANVILVIGRDFTQARHHPRLPGHRVEFIVPDDCYVCVVPRTTWELYRSSDRPITSEWPRIYRNGDTDVLLGVYVWWLVEPVDDGWYYGAMQQMTIDRPLIVEAQWYGSGLCIKEFQDMYNTSEDQRDNPVNRQRIREIHDERIRSDLSRLSEISQSEQPQWPTWITLAGWSRRE